MVASSTQTTDDLDCREKERLIAEHLMGYRWSQVGKDYDGQNEGRVLLPPGGLPPGYTYPPRGTISAGWHVRQWGTDPIYALQLLEWMRGHGSSLTLNWGEDNGLWECSWISSGDRFVGFASDWKIALLQAAHQAAARVKEERDAQEQ